MKFYELMKNAAEEVGMSLSEEQYNKFIKYKTNPIILMMNR